MAPAAPPARDRVAERRRAAALARHYRDAEQLPIDEIARRLGRAPATIKAPLYDPPGEKARAVKAATAATAEPSAPTPALVGLSAAEREAMGLAARDAVVRRFGFGSIARNTERLWRGRIRRLDGCAGVAERASLRPPRARSCRPGPGVV